MALMGKKVVETTSPIGKSKTGFTLLEVLLAITILGVVVGMVISAFKVGISSYKKVNVISDMNQEVMATMKFLMDDIYCMIPDKSHAIWKENRFSFLTMDKREKSSLIMVSYVLNGKKLLRMAESLSKKGPGATQSFILLEDIKKAEFEYLIKGSWVKKSLEYQKDFPSALRVGFEIQRRGDEYHFLTAYSLAYNALGAKQKK